jgi:seryl-tRNA synthetase
MTASPSELREQLVDSGLLWATGVDGLFGRSSEYQGVINGIDALVDRWGHQLGATTIHLPPVLARSTFDATGYLQSFPDLAGSVHVFKGGDREHAELVRRVEANDDWAALLTPAEVVLAPACCHGLYPMLRGQLAPGGAHFDVRSFCFRHEPSPDPTRMQAFHMHEIVYLGDPEATEKFRDEGVEAGRSMLERLGLVVDIVAANDPFFGRLGGMKAAGQRDEGLKLEGTTTVHTEGPTAVMSANCHRDHFGAPFGITTEDGKVAHSACVGFGADRIAIALFARHGMDSSKWPDWVRSELS